MSPDPDPFPPPLRIVVTVPPGQTVTVTGTPRAPCDIAEVAARVRACLDDIGLEGEAPAVYDDGVLSIDFSRHQVRRQGQPVSLTRKEFSLLALLAQQPGRLLTQSCLLRTLWGPTHEGDAHYLRILVGKLRQKLGDPRYILTEPGVGLRFLPR